VTREKIATMKVLILGDGCEERSWASWFESQSESHLDPARPELSGDDPPEVHLTTDLDSALATAGIDLVIVGGPPGFRAEALRRAAAEGLSIICLHPPGEDSEAYYQVSLSRSETGAVVVPDLPLRLHSGVSLLREAIKSAELGAFRGVRLECSAGSHGEDLVRQTFARVVDVVRSLIGEIEALTASGDPPGVSPEYELVVQLRAAEGRRAEIRVHSGQTDPDRLTVSGSNGSLTLEYDLALRSQARLIRRGTSEPTERIEGLDAWDPHAAIVRSLFSSVEAKGAAVDPEPGPSLLDGTRAMELSEAAVRSLRRGRTIDLHYEAISEEATFKSFMTSTGCVLLLGILLILPLALAGPALGIGWTIYFAYLIPPVLAVFVVAQLLRYGIRREERGLHP
jgi:myo-inositol 2-dehydrogenase/D-chiro-inositol 1-dehydrogenase